MPYPHVWRWRWCLVVVGCVCGRRRPVWCVCVCGVACCEWFGIILCAGGARFDLNGSLGPAHPSQRVAESVLGACVAAEARAHTWRHRGRRPQGRPPGVW